ncbi:MAG: DUF485 domain-containing protein [Chloroflexi bacterium]|uniref:DUF485 domain-containing protein n=1 Tax=Candidatus Chlorohelix allophototropha TaxID=3003348 RepID=A0A8T7M6P1_9CHLR|nr:DUF485 domain-containing protein [Chloroflexota bacterium]WJW69669.1 DUF485 domain-containing protein [Chloroflexota bacterium L227-S17]
MANVTHKPGKGSDDVSEELLTKAHMYEEIEQGEDFKKLTRARRNFIIPAMIIFIVYYFGMLVLINYFPSLMETDVIGSINLAYVMALSQFILAWAIAFAYLRVSTNVFDKLITKIIASVKHSDEKAGRPVRKENK